MFILNVTYFKLYLFIFYLTYFKNDSSILNFIVI